MNFLGGDGEAYSDNCARLSEIKVKYDPTNFFRRNQNIKPVARKDEGW